MHGVYLLDLVGVFAFAVFGARKGIRQNFGTFGVLACAFLTALGGGTIREVILHHQPAYFHNYTYLGVVVAATAAALLTDPVFDKVRRGMLVLDAVGLGAFAYIGAERGAAAGVGLAGMGLFAVLTAVGGGVLADVLCRQRPAVFFQDFYALPALLIGALCFSFGHIARDTGVAYLLIAGGCALRVGFLYIRASNIADS